MIEKLQQNPKPPLEPGMLVKITDDMSPNVRRNFEELLGRDKLHRVLKVEPAGSESGDVVWIGPSETSMEIIAKFDPFRVGQGENPEKERITRIMAEYLIPVHN